MSQEQMAEVARGIKSAHGTQSAEGWPEVTGEITADDHEADARDMDEPWEFDDTDDDDFDDDSWEYGW